MKAKKDDKTPKEIIKENEATIIESITKKAVKATMEQLQPLLDKLEEASKQLDQERNVTNNSNLNYEDQLLKMQNIAKDRLKQKELKIAKKVQDLQSKITSRMNNNDLSK